MVSLIIVDYRSINRTIEYIDEFIENIINSEIVNIIIVDNANDSKSIDNINKLELEKLDISVLKLEDSIRNKIASVNKYKYNNRNLVMVRCNENLGYAKGNNLGAMISKELFNDSYYIFSNNDLKFMEKIDINNLIEPFKKFSDVAVVGPQILGLDGKNQSPRKKCGIGKMIVLYHANILLFNLLHKLSNNLDYDNRSKYVYWVMGCFIVVDKNKFHEVNMFDEHTFLYAEEMILSERLLEKGYKNYFINDITIIHNHGQTVKSNYSIVKGCEISFNSVYYYFEKYLKVNRFTLLIARIAFDLFKILLPISLMIKNKMQKVTKNKN